MKAKWLGVTLLVAVAAACGEGHAIFSIDVHSFMTGGTDTLRLPPDPPPPLPPSPGLSPGASIKDSITPTGVDLPTAMSSSIVDTVLLTGSLDITNPTDSGSLSYEVFFSSSSDPAVVYGAAPALLVGPQKFPIATLTAPITQVPITSQNLAAVVGDAFKGSGLYVGIRATITNNGVSGDPDLKTTLKLTALQARIVFQDKIF